MALELPFGVQLVNPKPVEFFYDNDGTPWASVAAANGGITSGIRYIGLTCIIGTVEYWYKDGITDPDLVVKKTGDKHYEHVQGVANATWNVAHNLNKFPSVMVIDSSDNEVIGDITYTDNNNLVITFTAIFSGKAYMN